MREMLPVYLSHPPGEFSVMPFWFWNDVLEADEIIRQIDDFQQHGVDGFVIHPRVGLPRNLGWMSAELLGFYRVAIEAAQRRQMGVMLYDEGMYPSGSASGQVVAANSAFACRCLAKADLPAGRMPTLKPGENLVAILQRRNGSRLAVIDRPANSVIRGLHYIGDGPEEEEPLAADILNPQAVRSFIHLVYDKFAEYLGAYFGNTIVAIFTDEPGLLGRSRETGIVPGTTGILEQVNRILGYDFTPHLPALWYADEPEAARYRRDYAYAVSLRLEETYYQPLFAWCEQHGLALTGHPAKGDDIGPLRYFHIPGQDLVWRWVLPDQPSALEGPESTQVKCSSSAMLHTGRRRNANECCGAYGHEMTWEEMNWLARWAFVRGVNLLIPHAFYYSIRGPRRDERPPDVGPHSLWWDRYSEYALACRRLCWINTDSQPVCHLAILGQANYLPWRAAKQCFIQQYDFNYVEERDLLRNETVDGEGFQLAGMKYQALIMEHDPPAEVKRVLAPLTSAGRVFRYSEDDPVENLLAWLAVYVPIDVRVTPKTPALRVRHVVRDQQHYYMIFNEELAPIDFTLELAIGGPWRLYDAVTSRAELFPEGHSIHLDGYELKILITQKS
jgi:hypothetical protein